jgi:dihydrofolate reductase
MSTPIVSAIVAMDEARVIGKDGALPWHLPEDQAHFKKLTTGHIVIMGRKTWDSLPPKFRPLPNRKNVVVSRNVSGLALPDGVLGVASLEVAIATARREAQEGQRIWIIGGAQIYAAALPMCEEVHLTRVYGSHDGDARFPEFEADFEQISSTPGVDCSFVIFRNRERSGFVVE